MLAIGSHLPKRIVAIKHCDAFVLVCQKMWEIKLTPGCCCCSGSRGEPLLAAAHGSPGAVSGYCSFLPAPLADLSLLSALTGDQRTEWLKFLPPGKARWLCCLWSNLVPASVGALALAIVLFLESGKMPCLFWLLSFCSSAYRKFPLFSCWKHLPVPQTQLFTLLGTLIIYKLTTVLNMYRFLNYPV